MPGLPTGTVTMLFSDIEGSTMLLQRLGSRWAEALTLHRAVLREAFAQQGGHEMGTEGDSFFVVFPSAAQGLCAAVLGQRRLHAQAWPEGVELRVRMGLHTGEPQQVDGGYVGLEVHRAARVASTAHGGQVVVSDATAALGGTAMGGLVLRDQGWHRLKDLPAASHLHDVDLGEEFPPLRSLGTRSTLPVPQTQLLGREEDRTELVRLLGTPGVRLVTLTGAGGSGKTRLALVVAADVEPVVEHGVFFVGMHAVRDAAGAWAAVAEGLGAVVEGSADPRARTVQFLRDRRVLLVLDNLEQVQGADEVVAALLSAGAGVQVLATSRRCLRLVGEHERPVPPLPLPAGDGTDVQAAARSTAVQLFVRQARMVRPGFTLDPANVADVVALCQRLDGLPLALELAAARTRLFSPRALLDRLDDRLGTGVTAGDRPDRHRTLGATIAWSHDLLSADEQRAFARLGVFAASADLAAVEAVLAGHVVDPLDLVAALVDANLVLVVDTGDGDPRVTMLQTVRAHARQRLAEAPDRDEVRLRHAHWMRETTELLVAQLCASGHVAARDGLSVLDDDVRAALAWCLQPVEQVGAERAETGVALMTAMISYWYRFGDLAEGRAWTGKGLSVAEGMDGRWALQALHGLGVMTLQLKEIRPALEVFQRALALSRRLDDPSLESRELTSLGIAWREAGDLPRARELMERSAGLARSIGSARREATALTNLAVTLNDLGEYAEAVRVGRKAVAASEAMGDVWAAAIDRVNLAMALLRTEGPGAALAQVCGAADEALACADVELSISVVEVFAAVVAELELGGAAARLLGCADQHRERTGIPRSSVDQAVLDVSLNRVEGEPGWPGAYARGRSLGLAEAVAEASTVPVTVGR